MSTSPPQPVQRQRVPPQPPVLPPGPWSFPKPQRSRLDNGMSVLAYRLPGQHVISAHLVLDVPLAGEPRELEGVATITARCLDEGTATHPGEEFAEVLEGAGAGFGVDVALAGTQLMVDVPSTRLPQALALLAEAASAPALTADDVERHVALRLAEIEQAQANSAQLASMVFRSAVFDPESRVSRMSGGEPSTVSAIGPVAVRAFHEQWYGPQGTTLVLAGDFAGDPHALAEDAFGDWAAGTAGVPTHQVPAPQVRQLLVVDRPGSVQADVRLGGFGIDRLHPHWADITVAGYAMGGAFLSRLNRVLREEKGFTYGVRLAFLPLRATGSYAFQGSFRTEVVAEAVATARDLMVIDHTPFDAGEVGDAINYFTGVSPLRYATADGVADQAANGILHDLPEDYVDANLAAIRAVTPESAGAAYSELVDVENLTLVVVGDAERLAEPLRAAGFADLTVVESA